MNILVLYALTEKNPRKTILDSLYCFRNYDKKNHYTYLNIQDRFCRNILMDEKNTFLGLDAIIIHYSMISMRYDPNYWKKNKGWIENFLIRHQCIKVIIPQDEYNYNGEVKSFIRDCNIRYIFTCSYEEDYEKLYPKKEVGDVVIKTVFTGYVDENTLKEIKTRKEKKTREYDIGYRARKLPYWLGRHGQLKIELAEVFLEHLKDRTDIVYNINNTGALNQNVFYGNDWIDFLLDCRTMLGCLGGSGLLDVDGGIAKRVDAYCLEHPGASFDEVEKECFPGLDDYIHLYALSPRHFECAMTRTCQLLVEGDYQEVFRPGIDYIEIKRDFSNIDEVIEKVKDIEYCEKIADSCYEHVIESGSYTYRCFVEQVIDTIFDGREENHIIDKRLDWLYKKARANAELYRIKEMLSDRLFSILQKIFPILSRFRSYSLKDGLIYLWYHMMESKRLAPLKRTGFYKGLKKVCMAVYHFMNR